MKHFFVSTMMALLGPALPLFADPTNWTVGSFDMPESAIFDATHDRIVVSVIVGHPEEKDGNGHLALLSSDGERAYIRDLMSNRICQYQAGDMSVWLEDEALAHPNGLLMDGTRLVVGSWGQGMRDDFSTEVPGALLAFDLETKVISTIVPDLGNLDGVVRIGETLLVSDWITEQLFEVGMDGTHTVVAEYPAGLADIAACDNTLVFPSMLEGNVSARTYP